jgi:hypothetical protein
MSEFTPLLKKPKRIRNQISAHKKAVLIRRLWISAEQQIAELEKRLSHSMPVDSEREARSLAVLVKVLRELVILDEHTHVFSESKEFPKSPDSPCYVSLYDSSSVDQIRQTLAKRLALLRSSGESSSTSESM